MKCNQVANDDESGTHLTLGRVSFDLICFDSSHDDDHLWSPQHNASYDSGQLHIMCMFMYIIYVDGLYSNNT